MKLQDRAPSEDVRTYLEHFSHRVLQDALLEATTAYWLNRAQTFAAVGNERCDEIAQACRAKARVVMFDYPRNWAPIICTTCDTPCSPWACSCGATQIGGSS